MADRLIWESGPLTRDHGRARRRCANFRSPAGREGRLPTSVWMGQKGGRTGPDVPGGRREFLQQTNSGASAAGGGSRRTASGVAAESRGKGRTGHRWEVDESRVEVGDRRPGGERVPGIREAMRRPRVGE